MIYYEKTMVHRHTPSRFRTAPAASTETSAQILRLPNYAFNPIVKVEAHVDRTVLKPVNIDFRIGDRGWLHCPECTIEYEIKGLPTEVHTTCRQLDRWISGSETWRSSIATKSLFNFKLCSAVAFAVVSILYF
jgi:hypothetical protein